MKFYIALSLCFLVVSIQLAAQQPAAQPYITIEGEVLQPQKLYIADLQKLKRITVTSKTRDGKDHAYTGVPVAELLGKAGVTIGSQLHGENLAKYLLVTAADGYQVVFSLAELDSAFTDKQVILADMTDGAPLPAAKGPFQLIVPGEKKPARSCFQVTSFSVRFAKD